MRKERLVWDYDKWHDDEFKANYRMSKDKFRELVRAVGPSLPGWTKLSRRVVRAIVEELDSRGTCELPLDDTSKHQKIVECYGTSTNGVINRCVGS